ncbi:MAG: nucleotide 5'-monophosphate nucleosidase PpnN [Candidatus Azotimanducaceae bacterium WSBS_2022_MAG_OTU7]
MQNSQQKHSKSNLRPISTLNFLSNREIQGLMSSKEEVRTLFRECALAILNTGNDQDDVNELLEEYADFEIEVVPEARGPKIAVRNAPGSAFVDGYMIRGIQDHLFSVLRDVVYVNHILSRDGLYDLENSAGITEVVFNILRNANIVRPNLRPDLVVCWGGHSIDRVEYEYSKDVGYQMGLRGLNIATGCGPGAMKGPMKGAAIGHAKQQIERRRYIGITEPGIIATEAPNPIVNELVILPDIEKRLEAFVRVAHSIVVFPGGAGTAEEVLYLLSVLMSEHNRGLPYSFILTAPAEKADYFDSLDRFIRGTLGEEATQHYQIVVGDPARVAQEAKRGVERVRKHRMKTQDAYGFNWNLTIEHGLQRPFIATHENMAALNLTKDQPPHQLAAELRCAFSGIVSGNVKASGIQLIKEHGPYRLKGDVSLMAELDLLLQEFIRQKRMKINVDDYQPCWIVDQALSIESGIGE